MKQILLTKGYSALVDDEDFEGLAKYRWCASVNNGKAYAIRRPGKDAPIYMHRVLALAPDGKCVDHENGDTLDNRRSNLRICSQSQNMCNRPAQANSASGHKGVSWNKALRKWCVQVSFQRRCRYRAHFSDIEEAIAAHRHAIAQIHGEFAKA